MWPLFVKDRSLICHASSMFLYRRLPTCCTQRYDFSLFY